MMSSVTLRRAMVEDVEELVELRLALMHSDNEHDEQTDDESWKKATRLYFLESLPAGTFIAWVAEAQGKIVACSGLVFFQKPPSIGNLSGLEGYILNMYTLPQWRGQGLATKLLQKLLDHAKQTKAGRVWLMATAPGKPIYEKAGFVMRPAPNMQAMDLTL